MSCTQLKFLGFLKRNNIGFTKYSYLDSNSYKKEWFRTYVPENKQEEALSCHCLDMDGWAGYLWHVFSFHILKCLRKDMAREAFNQTYKKEAVLLFSVSNEVYMLDDISRLIDQDFDNPYDIVLTAKDYSWTYVKTHECTCGPYFYIPK